MAHIIEWVSYAIFGGVVFMFAILISGFGGIIDSISWVYGKTIAVLLYGFITIAICGATHNMDFVQQSVDGLPGFNRYWVIAIGLAIIPFVGTARVAGFLSVLICTISGLYIIYGG